MPQLTLNNDGYRIRPPVGPGAAWRVYSPEGRVYHCRPDEEACTCRWMARSRPPHPCKHVAYLQGVLNSMECRWIPITGRPAAA
jgi:hypothetical protein